MTDDPSRLPRKRRIFPQAQKNMHNNPTEIAALTRAYRQMLKEAAVLWPKPSLLHLAPSEQSEEDMIPVPTGVVMLCSIFSATADDGSLGALAQAIRQHFGFPLSDCHITSLLHHAGDTDTLGVAATYEIALYLYPNGRVWVPVTDFATYYERGVWHVHAAGLPVATTTTLAEMVKLITAYGRDGLRPAALE